MVLVKACTLLGWHKTMNWQVARHGGLLRSLTPRHISVKGGGQSERSDFNQISCIWLLPSYGTAVSMIPWYLFCLYLCTAAPPSGVSIYIFINTTVTFIGTSGHSVEMSWIFVNTRIFIFSLEIAGIFILPWYHALLNVQ
jgi:hypothetical protein